MVRIIWNGSSLIDGLEDYSYFEICQSVLAHISDCIEEYDMECRVTAMSIYGSRKRLTSTIESDLDVVVEYEGKEREDDCFNLFNEEPLYINDIKVDINPIKASKSGHIEDFLERTKIKSVEFRHFRDIACDKGSVSGSHSIPAIILNKGKMIERKERLTSTEIVAGSLPLKGQNATER